VPFLVVVCCEKVVGGVYELCASLVGEVAVGRETIRTRFIVGMDISERFRKL
jgi:hypothetical protein